MKILTHVDLPCCLPFSLEASLFDIIGHRPTTKWEADETDRESKHISKGSCPLLLGGYWGQGDKCNPTGGLTWCVIRYQLGLVVAELNFIFCCLMASFPDDFVSGFSWLNQFEKEHKRQFCSWCHFLYIVIIWFSVMWKCSPITYCDFFHSLQIHKPITWG